MRQTEILETIQTAQYGRDRPFVVRCYIGEKQIIKQSFASRHLAWAYCQEWDRRGVCYWSNVTEDLSARATTTEDL